MTRDELIWIMTNKIGFELELLYKNPDQDAESYMKFYRMLENLIYTSARATGMNRSEVSKLAEDIIDKWHHDNRVNHANENMEQARCYYVSKEHLVDAINFIDKAINDDDTAMMSNLETGELMAECIGHHIWYFC